MINVDMIFQNTKNKYKVFGIGILLVPIFILLAFAIGEGLSPEFGISGFILHFAQALPLLGLLYVAWRWPKVGGRILIFGGLLLALLYVAVTAARGQLGMAIVPVLIIFIPPVLAGWLLVLSVKHDLLKKGS